MGKRVGNWLKENYQRLIIWALAIVPILVSLISTIHVVNFFKLSNYQWLAITLAIAFEIGALSSLAALAIMDKISKTSLWLIFILITLMQMMGNTYYAFDFITAKMHTDSEWTMNWIELFSIQTTDVPTTKRLLAIVSGAILPVVSLSFLHILINYLTKIKEQEDQYEYIEEYVDVDSTTDDDQDEEDYYSEPNEELLNTKEQYNDETLKEVEQIENRQAMKPAKDYRKKEGSIKYEDDYQESIALANSQYRERIAENDEEEYFEINEDNTIDSEVINNMNKIDLSNFVKALLNNTKLTEDDVKKFVNEIKVNANKKPNGVIDLSKYITFKQGQLDPEKQVTKHIHVNTSNLQSSEEVIEDTQQKMNEDKPVEMLSKHKEKFNSEHTKVMNEVMDEITDEIKEIPPVEEPKPISSFSTDPEQNNDYKNFPTTHEQQITTASGLAEPVVDTKETIKAKPQKKKILLYREKKN